MTKIKCLTVAFAIMAFFSCSKEDGTDNLDHLKTKASITVNIKGSVESMSKAAGDPGASTDVVVNDFIIFLFDASGNCVGTPKYVTGATTGTVDDANTSASKIYVVANTGAIASGPFASVANENDLKACTGTLVNATDASTQTKNNLWMSGTGTIGTFTPGANPSDPSTASATVTLAFVAARIDVVVVDNRTNNTPGSGKISIADNSVALLFAGAEGKFFAESAVKVAQSSFFSGITTNTTANTTKKDILNTPLTQAFGTTGAVEYHFYTFGYNGEHDFGAGWKLPTILTIASTRTNANGSTTPIYYPVHFNASDAGMTIEPGNKYTVTLTLNGDVNGGGGGGSTDPERPLEAAEITVSVTPATWTPKVVDKEFN